jgi:hypothetical protein
LQLSAIGIGSRSCRLGARSAALREQLSALTLASGNSSTAAAPLQ